MKEVIKRQYLITLLNDEANDMDRKRFLKAMKEHSDSFYTMATFIIIVAITMILALLGVV